jgi:hypothetical protein
MIKFNLDICTTRRVSGWLYDEETLLPVDDFYIGTEDGKFKISLKERNDVAAAFGLGNPGCGFEVNIPDIFDGLVSDYCLYIRDHEVFSYRAQIAKLKTILATFDKTTAGSANNIKTTDYRKGRHVVFLYETSEIPDFLDAIFNSKMKQSFPNIVAGCEFSHSSIQDLADIKSAIIDNISNILLITPSLSYARLNSISPSILQAGRFITLYSDGSLQSAAGLHEHQLNNFAIHKTKEYELPLYQASIIRIWELIENYADLVFQRSKNIFFISTNNIGRNSLMEYFISKKIQGKKSENVIRITHNNLSILLVNIAAYIYLFDVIGRDDCWDVAIKRGLTHSDLVL